MLREYPFFSIEECEEIKEYIYKKEVGLREIDYISYNKTPTKKYKINSNSFNQYNFLTDHPIYANRLVNLLKNIGCPVEYPILIQSWINIYRKGDGIGWHGHQGNGFSFNIFIDGDISTGPVYLLTGKLGGLDKYDMQLVNFKNKKGYIQIFPSPIFHKVDPVSSERTTIGGTIYNYSSMSAHELSSLCLNSEKDYILLKSKFSEQDFERGKLA